MNPSRTVEKRLVIAFAAALFAAGILVPARTITARHELPAMRSPVLLGTNELKIGAKLYGPNNPTNLLFTVLDIDPAYDFPDDDFRPGVKVQSPAIGSSSWVPRDSLSKCLVVQ
jgi:hypothetical protein